MESKLSKREELAYLFYKNSTVGRVVPYRESKSLLIDAFLQADEFISMSEKDIHKVFVYNKLRQDENTDILCSNCGKVLTDYKNCVVKTYPMPLEGATYQMVRQAFCPECKPVK